MLPVWVDQEERERYEQVGSVAREHLRSMGLDTGGINRSLLSELGRSGLLPAIFPARLGGSLESGVSAVRLCVLREALAQFSTQAETALALQGLGSYPILQSGRDELIEEWIPRVATGEAAAAFALTEPQSGSDAGALSLKAEPAEGGFRLSGSKKWISNAPEADIYALFARTSEDGPRGITAFAVPGDSPGMTGSPLDLVSPHPIGTLELDDVFVPAANVLGDVGGGFTVAMKTLDLFRPSVGAFAVGMAQAALDAAIEYAKERHVFGKALTEFQAVSHQIAEMATRTQAARLLVYEAALMYDRGEPVTKASAMAKLYATETAQFVIDSSIQVHGAKSLEKGHLLEHLYRDVRGTRIYEGTSQIQREVIARRLLRD